MYVLHVLMTYVQTLPVTNTMRFHNIKYTKMYCLHLYYLYKLCDYIKYFSLKTIFLQHFRIVKVSVLI